MNRIPAYYSRDRFSALLFVLPLSVVMALVTGQYVLMAMVPAWLLLSIGTQYPKLLFFVMLATIPVSIELMLTDNLGTDFPDEMLMWILTAIIPILLILNPSAIRSLLIHPLMLLLVTGLCWTIITIFYSTQPALSVKFFLAKAWYIIPFCLGTMIFMKDRRSMMMAAKCILITMVLVTMVILARHALAGFSFEQVNEAARPMFRNHVNYAALLVCMLPVSYVVYKTGRRFKYVWFSVLVLLLIALFFTYSRGAWLALGAALVTIFFVKRRILSWLVISGFAVVIGMILWFSFSNRYLDYRPVYEQTIYHENFDEHIRATYAMRDLSTAERFYRWIAALRMSRERPLTGYGPNSFYYEYKPYAVNAFSTYVSANQEHSTVHNYFLLLLVEQGIPGLVLFTALFFSMMFYAQYLYHHSEDDWERGLMLLIMSVLSMIGVLIFLSDLMETDKIGSIFYICLGLLVSAKARRSSV